MKKLYRILPFVLGLLLFSCNHKVFMNIEEIPLPPEARSATIEGRYEVELDSATNTILSSLKKDYSRTEEKILLLPPESEPARIFEFYEPKLAEKGFTKDESIPASGKNYQLRVWRNDGWFSGQAVAVAVIETGRDAGGRAIKFLAVYAGGK